MTIYFTEIGDHASYSYEIDSILEAGASNFQTYKVLHTTEYGNLLALDDVVMLTEKDEFVYHELIAHIPVLYSPVIKNILVVGGGDGGTVRELVKHTGVESVTLCEIDGKVPELAKRYFPTVACELDHKKVDLRIEDGVKFVHESKDQAYDIIIIDSSDPIGPGVGLFTEDFYRECQRILSSRGCLVAQTESPWFPKKMLGKINQNIAQNFKFVRPYLGSVPTYPKGLWSWTIASDFEIKPKEYDSQRFDEVKQGLSYLNDDMVPAVFALPNFYRQKLSC